MLRSTDFNSFTDFLEAVIASNTNFIDLYGLVGTESQEGLILEFGVASGRTINIFNNCFSGTRAIHGFDWFEGLPEDWRDNFPTGSFQCSIPKVPDNVKLHIGLFQDTLGKFLEQELDTVAFVHMDADLYSSTEFVFRQIESRFTMGTLVYFDELYYPTDDYREHEYKAFVEHHERTGFHYEFLGRCNNESYGFKLI